MSKKIDLSEPASTSLAALSDMIISTVEQMWLYRSSLNEGSGPEYQRGGWENLVQNLRIILLVDLTTSPPLSPPPMTNPRTPALAPKSDVQKPYFISNRALRASLASDIVAASIISFRSISNRVSCKAHVIKAFLSDQLQDCLSLSGLPSCNFPSNDMKSSVGGAPEASSTCSILRTAATCWPDSSCLLMKWVFKTELTSFDSFPAKPFAQGVSRPALLQAIHKSPTWVTDTQQVAASPTASGGRFSFSKLLRHEPSLNFDSLVAALPNATLIGLSSSSPLCTLEAFSNELALATVAFLTGVTCGHASSATPCSKSRSENMTDESVGWKKKICYTYKFGVCLSRCPVQSSLSMWWIG